MSDTLRFPWDHPPEFFQPIEVAEGILWIRLPLPMVLDHVNVFALDEGDSWCLVDTGLFTKRSVAQWEQLLAGPLSGKPVGRVIITHHHPDHIGMAGWFQAHGAELVATRTAWLLGRMLVLDEQHSWPEESQRFYRRSGMPPKIFEQRASERPFNFSDMVHPMPLGFTRISDGDTLNAGGRNWTVRVGHGHAPEHATLWSDDGALVIGGDQLLATISPNLGVYPTEPEADPVGEWLDSCARFAEIARPDQLILPGHKLPFRGLPVRLEQLSENHHGALARMLEILDKPRTAHECFSALFKREITASEYGLALVEAIAHVNHLYLSGQVRRDLNEMGAYEYTRIETSNV
ncbi:MAG: MBL fold metallo-hydrolase [Pseudomonadota bacterium]